MTWKFRGLFQQSVEGKRRLSHGGGRRPAAGALIDETLAGEPLDAAAEHAAQANGWR